MSPSGFDSEISIHIGLDLQDAYDQSRAMERVFRAQLIALDLQRSDIYENPLSVTVHLADAKRKAEAMADAWKAAAEALEESGFVCLHPDPRRIKVDEGMDICLDCERAIRPRQDDG